jgi:uncharacterized protein YdhG (YjbR/CyaY superfamily)
MASRPQSVDDYLATLPADQRATLQALRDTVRAAAPQAVECISYGAPAFKAKKMLVAFKAAKNHLSLHPWDDQTVAALKDELAGFDTSPGTIRFTPDRPLPEALVRKIVARRLAVAG